MDHPEAREALVDAGRRLARRGLVIGSSGNLSIREGAHVVATPTGCSLAAMEPLDMSVIDLDGTWISGPPPTSEVPLHLGIYRSTAAGAVAHTHAVASTAASCTCDELPALHYNVLALGGPPRSAAYATFGTEQLAANVVAALAGDRTAALMQNHGSIAYGTDMAQACDRLELLEWLCELHLAAHRLGGPRVLSAVELTAAATAIEAGARPSNRRGHSGYHASTG